MYVFSYDTGGGGRRREGEPTVAPRSYSETSLRTYGYMNALLITNKFPFTPLDIIVTDVDNPLLVYQVVKHTNGLF